MGYDSKEDIDARQERLTYHHEYVGLENQGKPCSKQRSVASFFGKAAAAPAAKAGGGGTQPAPSSKWVPPPPLLMLPPHATDEARAAAADGAPRGQLRAAGTLADDEAAPKAARRLP